MTENQKTLDLLAAFADSVVASTKAANFDFKSMGAKANKERAAAKRLLAHLFKREPTDTEICQVISG